MRTAGRELARTDYSMLDLIFVAIGIPSITGEGRKLQGAGPKRNFSANLAALGQATVLSVNSTPLLFIVRGVQIFHRDALRSSNPARYLSFLVKKINSTLLFSPTMQRNRCAI